MIDRAPPGSKVRAIVFDLRGNTGGNSGVGQFIFDALTGGLVFDASVFADRPSTFALWRVSPLSIAKLADTTARLASNPDRDPHEMAIFEQLLTDAQRAFATHGDWIRQDDGDRKITRDDIASAGGHLRDFNGLVAVLTDGDCVSACLDFVDTVRQVPGSLHLGAATGADTNDIDVARAPLPSGNVLVVPVKVWRKRLRASNEVLVPALKFDGDLADDALVKPWVLEQVDRAARRRGSSPASAKRVAPVAAACGGGRKTEASCAVVHRRKPP